MRNVVKELEWKAISTEIRWKELKGCGSRDIFWPDGVHLNLLRKHIFYFLGELKKEGVAVDIDPPPEVEPTYMVRPRECRCMSMLTDKKEGNLSEPTASESSVRSEYIYPNGEVQISLF